MPGETGRTLRFNRIPTIAEPLGESRVEDAVPHPIDDSVFPSEVYATAEPGGWGPERNQDFIPVIQPDLNMIQIDRRVAVYVLKEIKQLKVKRELV